ncbi:MAG TPA: hypothetical protein PK845_07385 [Petrotogaceae bacterium]|nr:hypothetical protein [Petrotogaceae bacterium]
MKKRIFTFIIVLSLSFAALAANFGIGGPFGGFMPSDQMQNPISGAKFENGLFYLGGMGFGKISDTFYMGGEGYDGSSTTSDGHYVYKSSYGAFVVGTDINILSNLSLNIGLGIGGMTDTIQALSAASGTSINNVQDGTARSYIKISRDYYTLAPQASLYFKFVDFFGLNVTGRYMVGYSPFPWKLETNDNVSGIVDNSPLRFSYSIGAGLFFGF